MSTNGLVDTKQPGAAKRRQYSEALKRPIVAETLASSAVDWGLPPRLAACSCGTATAGPSFCRHGAQAPGSYDVATGCPSRRHQSSPPSSSLARNPKSEKLVGALR